MDSLNDYISIGSLFSSFSRGNNSSAVTKKRRAASRNRNPDILADQSDEIKRTITMRLEEWSHVADFACSYPEEIIIVRLLKAV
jgi:hypothetical protein